MTPDVPPNPLEKPGYRLDFHDEFEDAGLDESRWVPYYLPQWSTREQSRPRYTLGGGALTLQIDANQQPWCPEFDGAVKCSSLQTGLFCGPLGSRIGQHRFNDHLIVRQEQPTLRTYVPRYGYFELRAKAVLGPDQLAAVWMIGLEETPEDSGEITIVEIFGNNIAPEGTRLGHGLKRINDPRLAQDFHEDLLPFDPAAYHVYACEWRPDVIHFYLDDRRLRTIAQSPGYPMQFMVNVYELPGAGEADRFQPLFTIDYFRAYQPLGGY